MAAEHGADSRNHTASETLKRGTAFRAVLSLHGKFAEFKSVFKPCLHLKCHSFITTTTLPEM
jgi:hypothetical protein